MISEQSHIALRPLPSSPSLAALLDLVPPSPILSPSDLSTSITSGEIPFLLFHSTPDNREQDLFFYDSSPRTWQCEFDLSRSTSSTARHDLHGGYFSLSTGLSDGLFSDAYIAFDTLGDPIRKSAQHRPSLCWSSDSVARDFIRDGRQQLGDHSLHPVKGDEHVYYEDSWISAYQRPYSRTSTEISNEEEWQSNFLPLDPPKDVYLEPSSPRNSFFVHAPLGNPRFSPSLNSTLQKRGSLICAAQGIDLTSSRRPLQPAYSSHTDDPRSAEIDSIDSCMHELLSCVWGSSTLVSTSSFSRTQAIHRASSQRKIVQDTETPSNIIPLNPQIQAIQPTPRPGDNVVMDREIGSISTGSSDTYFSEAEHKVPPLSRPPFTPLPIRSLSPQECPTKLSVVPHNNQPHQHPWLQGMTVSLLVDQEGFRTIEPQFKLTSVSKRRLADFGNVEIDVATFAPFSKQAFRFHYAPFDGLPVLRRLMINGDQNRDFLSRQAYLGLKTSGTYTVHGTEIETSDTESIGTPNTRTQETVKLYWQFDYIVEDRHPEQPGRASDGERIIIPLAFLCSPRLLHPNQGKKIKLIQIVKKTVVPKLVAEKIDATTLHVVPRLPPMMPPTPTTPHSPPKKLNLAQHVATDFYNKTQAWTVHRRSQSNPRETREASMSLSPRLGNLARHRNSVLSPCEKSAADAKPVLVEPSRRRRASSAGEKQAGVTTASPIRHILPPSRLRQLFESDTHSEQEPSLVPHATRQRSQENSEFHPLRPGLRLKRK